MLLLHLLVLLLLLLRLRRLMHTLVMVSLRGVQAGGTQQGSAFPEQRCHLHPGGCFVRVAVVVVSSRKQAAPTAGVASSRASIPPPYFQILRASLRTQDPSSLTRMAQNECLRNP